MGLTIPTFDLVIIGYILGGKYETSREWDVGYKLREWEEDEPSEIG